jgi:plastocyanin
MKRLTLLALPALIAAVIVLPIAIAAGATSVNVSAKEYKFTFSPSSARHGTVTFRVTNRGKLAHDLKIAGKKTRIVQKGKTATLTVTLKKGSYRYLCTIPGHAALGMKGTLRVR